MRTALLSFAAALYLIALTGCEQCATCTTVSDDPQTVGQTLSTEVCGTGKEYTDQVEIYERNNWTCSENSN